MLEGKQPILPLFSVGITIVLLLLCCCLSPGRANPVFKIYPLADDYFEKIYFLNHKAKSYYLSISCKEKDMLSISISEEFTFQEAPRFNIYGNLKNIPKMGRGIYTFLRECNAQVEVDNRTNFLEVRRNDTQKLVFALADLAIREMHAKFTVRDQSVKWGLGERFQRHFEVTDGSWTLWNRDRPWKIDDGRKGDSQQTYGHQPVYLARQKTGLHHLVYFKNTHGLLVESQEETNELIFNSVGGTLHFIILLGQQDPQPLLKRYHDYIGHSHIPPFWSLGYHQCRWGYRTLQDLIEVIKQFNKNDLPIDSIWSDLEYMNKKMIFTINQLTHPAKKLSQLLIAEQLHFIPLMDVGVSLEDLPAVTLGKKMDVFLKNPGKPNECYVGHVWPGQVHFVDYLHPNASDYWKQQLGRLHQSVNFSGMWLDMNQPANFRGGEATTEPFRIQHHQNINTMTINVDLNHHTESHHEQLKHREVHTYYGHLSTVPTFEFLSEKGRPFIISRSNSVGSGVFAGHWTGDNVANWQFLRSSINANFLYQIFGMQMVGADICGFYQDTTEQLCARWMQLGALYPFARNHNHLESISQQPYSFSQLLLETSRLSLKFRYSFLRHMYSLMVHQKGRGSFFRPLSFQFYSDEYAYEEDTIQTQFLVGRFLLAAPIVHDAATQRSVYFPGAAEQWYSFILNSKTGQADMASIKVYEGETSEWISNQLPSPPPTFLRGGFLLFSTEPANRSIKLLRQFHVLAALKENQAVGQIMGIEDYNYEPHIAKCIEDTCHYTIRITKTGKNQFGLSWKYDGDINIRSNLVISSIQITFAHQKWRSSERRQLVSAEGSIIFMAEELHL